MTLLADVVEERRGEVAIVWVRGEIDASNAEWLGSRLRGMLTNRSDALVVDLSSTTYLDSAGIALLFGLAGELALHQQDLRLVVLDGSPIMRMLALTGLDRTIATHRSLEEALASA